MEAAVRFESIVYEGSWAEAGAADWEELVDRTSAALKARIRHVLWLAGDFPDPGLIEEVLQDVYYRLFSEGSRRLLQFRGGRDGRLLGYLRAVASRVAIDHLRHRRAEKRCPKQVLSLEAITAALAGYGIDPRGNPEEIVLSRESARLLLAHCVQLARPELRRRNARILCLASAGWSSGEISRALGGRPGPGGIDSLLYRLRQGLLETGWIVPGAAKARRSCDRRRRYDSAP